MQKNKNTRLTKSRLAKTLRHYDQWPFIPAEDYHNFERYWDDVESAFSDWKQGIADALDVTPEELDAFVEHCPACGEYVPNDKWLLYTYCSYYYEDAWEQFPEWYEYDPQFKCTVCGRPIEYSSEYSVMLRNDVWHRVLQYFNLDTVEDDYARRRRQYYEMCHRRGGQKGKAPDDTFLYVCNDCVEEALGRAIRPTDLMNCPFNNEYKEEHFPDAVLTESLNEDVEIDDEEDVMTARIFAAAKRYFGTTYDIREAGYILPDGSMLDFSGRHESPEATRGERPTDHREISKIKYLDPEARTDICDFIRRGAIRVDCNAGSINLSKKPTREQRDVLRRIIQKNDGWVILDFGYTDTEHYKEYEDAKYTKVLGDIDRYYDEGIKP